MEALKPGQTIELADGRRALVRFVGETSFAAGEWVGVEFEEPLGKNDGSVQGERYFECEAGHGMFLRPAAVAGVVEMPKPAAKGNGRPTAPTATARAGRPSSIAGRVSIVPGGLAKTRQSSVAEESRDGTPSSGRTSPAKKPLSTTTARARPSMAPPATKRTSIAPSPSIPPSARPVKRQSLAPPLPINARTSYEPSKALSPTSQQSLASSKAPSPTAAPAQPGRKSISPAASTTSLPTTSQPPTSRPNDSAKKEIEELQAKLRILEKKRLEDRDKLKTLERTQAERDKFESIIHKLQSKYQPQQAELADLKRQLKDARAALEAIEAKEAEHDTLVESATLDREMAEEQVEAFKAELEGVKQRLEELELENEILREENRELGTEMTPEERASQGWLQKERESERLREALLRLRDVSQEQEAELKRQVNSLEEDVKELATVKQEYDDTKAKLLEAEADTEDLRQQLDAALGAEDMIEELTEKNLSLSEQVEELRNTIDDFEALKELNDELEVNHIENEKQLQEVVNHKDSLLGEQTRRIAQQEEALADQEYTILRFRELVTNMQSDLEDMRASKEITESEAQELSTRSRAMMDLNRQLQASATNSKVKAIDMELRKLEAQEAAEHLAIVQLFLPEAFQAERDSVLALLRFKRIGFKAHLLHGFIRDKVSTDSPHARDEHVFAACAVLDQLTWIAAMCDRFSNSISSSSLEQFARFEGALYELEPVERALNSYIDRLKRDELREEEVTDELQRSISLMTHLGEVHLHGGLESYADEVLMKTLLMQSHLENTAAALNLVKAEIQTNIPATDDDEGELAYFLQKADAAISHSRSAKVMVSKTVRSLQDLKARSLALSTDALPAFEQAQSSTAELTKYIRHLGTNVSALLHEEGRAVRPSLAEVLSAIIRTTSTVFEAQESTPLATLTVRLRSLTDTTLPALASRASDLTQTTEFERPRPPWVQRSRALAASKIVSVDAEEELRRLRDDLRERAMLLQQRDAALEEAGVKVELLEARNRDAAKRAGRIRELEASLTDAVAREKKVAERLEAQATEVSRLEGEREKWRTAAAAAVQRADTGKREGGAGAGGEMPVATARELEGLRAEIRVLEEAVRYLRSIARKERTGGGAAAQNAWLEVPVVPARKPTAEGDMADGRPPKGSRLALQELTNLPAAAKMVRLAREPQGKLKWRPKVSTPQYQLRVEEERKAATWSLWGSDARLVY